MATARLDISGIVLDGKNSKQIVCPRCGSKILPPKMGSYEETEFELQSMKKDTAGTAELLDQFYRVEDMFDFDNMGFTNTVEHIKFLSCGDCEVGPLGYHNLQTKKSYLALARISYKE